MAGAETWHRILNAIERLQAKTPGEEIRCISRRGRPIAVDYYGTASGNRGLV